MLKTPDGMEVWEDVEAAQFLGVTKSSLWIMLLREQIPQQVLIYINFHPYLRADLVREWKSKNCA